MKIGVKNWLMVRVSSSRSSSLILLQSQDNYKQKEQHDAELQDLKKKLTRAAVYEYEDVIKDVSEFNYKFSSAFSSPITQGLKRPQKPIPPRPEDLVSILYTSGTTGVPKVAIVCLREKLKFWLGCHADSCEHDVSTRRLS